jgi:hypothetical protein
MLSTKNLVNSYKDVPITWIFENYCKLPYKLIGQDVKIKSLFNDKDKTPSMCIYFDKAKSTYKFKDFSSGIGGSAFDLVKELKKVNWSVATTLILEDYNEYILHNNGGYNIEGFKQHNKYKVTSHVVRGWNTRDQNLWTPYYIGSKFLTEYLVKPFESYTMSKEEDGIIQEMTITGDYIYGYFNKAGELCKIYQPKTKNKKFIKVKDYIQGSDQLKGYDYLIINSGIKDIGAMHALKLSNIDYVAPDAEGVMIPPKQMQKYLTDYKLVMVMFDNDEAGIKAMKKYREMYNTPCILLTLAKDVAEAVKLYKPKVVRDRLVPLINKFISEI